ncbi:DUF4395 domain-containing protein [Lysinibacillus sp. 54212]|uniref:DUF4395 domain-containing protein n=1 Tax=Lysinibacillus sp. 54212 TaxID=3119829 RepID=UPI002FCBCA44
MSSIPLSVPRPLVRVNQWTIFISVILTWVTGYAWIILIPLIANLLGITFGVNPIMRFAKLFLLKEPKSYIPEDPVQQRFNSSIATFCLAGGFISFSIGWNTIAYIFTAMVAIASFIAILGFCVGCFVHFQLNQLIYRRAQKQRLKEN